MIIHNGDANGLKCALALIEADPNPDHIEEYRLVNGRDKGILAMIDDSVAASCLVGYAERDGEAFAGGVSTAGFISYQIWMLSTRNAGRSPRWLLRESRKFLAEADRFFGFPCSFFQFIPSSYRAGLHFVRHLGFKETRRVPLGDGETEAVCVERAIPKWER